MPWLENLLGGAAGAAIVSGFFGVIMWLLNRRAKKEDIAQAASDAKDQEIQDLRNVMDRILAALQLDYYNQIKKLAKKYIARKYIYVEEYEDLSRMYDMYHDPDKLDGNGLLKSLKAEVDQLEKRVH